MARLDYLQRLSHDSKGLGIRSMSPTSASLEQSATVDENSSAPLALQQGAEDAMPRQGGPHCISAAEPGVVKRRLRRKRTLKFLHIISIFGADCRRDH